MTGKLMNFKIHNKNYMRSSPGGFLSLIFYAFCAYYILQELYFYISNPHVLNYQIQTVPTPAIKFEDYKDFFFMSCKVDSRNNSIANLPELDEHLEEEILLNLVHRLPFYSRTYQPVKLEKCNYNLFPAGLVNPRIFSEYYQYCKCAHPNNLKAQNLSFFFTDTYYNYMEHTIKFKREVFQNEEVKKKVYQKFIKEPPRMEFFFLDTSANIRDKDNPFKYFLGSRLGYLNPDFLQFSDIYFKKIDMKVDDDFFYAGMIFYVNFL